MMDGSSGQKRPNFVKKAHCVQVKALIIEDFLLASRAVTDKSIRKKKHPMERIGTHQTERTLPRTPYWAG